MDGVSLENMFTVSLISMFMHVGVNIVAYFKKNSKEIGVKKVEYIFRFDKQVFSKRVSPGEDRILSRDVGRDE